MPSVWIRLLAMVALLFAAQPAAAAQPRALSVFAAASLRDALDEVDAAFAKAGGPAVKASFAASSTLARQIEQGAPADVFVSADAAWMDYAAERKLIRPGSRTNLLTNRLALIAPAASTAKLSVRRGFPLAQALGDGRLAMAGPDVPAGRYGRAALESLGVWGAVQAKAAYGENVRAALNFVARGEAPFGVVYDTDAMVEPKVRIVAIFPASSHPPIVYPAAVVVRSTNPDAQRYLAYLKGPEAAAIFRRFGFGLAR